MEKTIAYLKKQGFKVSEKVESLKVVKSIKNDKRYFWDATNNGFGLHISNSNFDDIGWDVLKNDLKKSKPSFKVLYLGINNLKYFSLSGEDFEDLEFLNLSQNKQIKSIELNDLRSLTELYADSCQNLDSLKLEGNFESLQRCNVSFCNLQNLVLPKVLPKLEYFNFSRNKLKSFQFLEFIANEPTKISMEYIFWQNNPLPETFTNSLNRNDLAALKLFFEGELIRVFRKKLILLGNTQAGKTSLCDILKNEDLANGTSTHGVNICRYELGENRIVQLYDFGGQDFYHNAHLPFYAMNTNYLLIYGNQQEDKYGTVKANEVEREDDIFPMDYWLNSVKSNLKIKQVVTNDNMGELLEKRGIKLSLLENLRAGTPKRLLNEKDLVKKFGVSDFYSFELRQPDGKKISDKKQEDIIRKTINQWLNNSLKVDSLPKKIKDWGDILIKDNWEAVSSKSKFTNINENEFKLLHDSYTIHLCEEKDEKKLPKVLNDNVIVNLGVFTKWVYAILNLKLQREEKGIFDKAKSIEYLKEASEQDTFFSEAENHIDFIINFLKYYKMIFNIKDSSKYIVPQYLPEPKDTDPNILVLRMFNQPFIKYIFKGFYHTQTLTSIIAEFFDREDIGIAKEKIGKEYNYFMWKNKVILYLSDDEKLNPQDFLLIEFKVVNQEPMLLISETGQNSLVDSYEQLKEIIDFIEKCIENIEYEKRIITPNKTYILANLLQEEQLDKNGRPTEIIYDSEHKCVYYKSDFPFFFKSKNMKASNIIPYRKPKFFISYANANGDHFDCFLEKLDIATKHIWEIWTDKNIPIGENWRRQIESAVQDCDFAILAVSSEFLASDFIRKDELAEFIKKVTDEKAEFKFFPFLLKPTLLSNSTDLEEFEILSDTQFYKSNGKKFNRMDKENQLIAFSELLKRDGGRFYADYDMDTIFVNGLIESIKNAIKTKE